MAIAMVTVFLTSCEKDEIERQLVTDYFEGEKLLSKYIEEEDGVFILTERNPYKIGIDPSLFTELETGFNEMNNLVKKGEIKPEWIGNTIDPETMKIIDIASRGCNENNIDFHWTCATVRMSTNSASWASIAGCGVVGLAGFWPGVACRAGILALNQFVCTCGYKIQVTYSGKVNWKICQ